MTTGNRDYVTYNAETRLFDIYRNGEIRASVVEALVLGDDPQTPVFFEGEGEVPVAGGEAYIREGDHFVGFRGDVLAADFRGLLTYGLDVLTEMRNRYGNPTSIRFGESTVRGGGPYSHAEVVHVRASDCFSPLFLAFQPYVRMA